jgi:hypothetical protein
VTPERLVLAASAYHVALGVFHVAFWKLFRWREDLPRLTPVNRGVLQVLNIMACYVFFAVALLQGLNPEAWTAGAPGRAGLVAVAGFWLLRAALQPIFWRRTAVSWAFCALFLLGAGLHLAALR